MSKNTFYVTTPLYYVNAKPHVGTLYSTLLADVAARWHRLRGDEVFFLTGTDEHGQKIAQQAASADMSPQQFADSVVPDFQTAWEQFGISYDHFIRTTDESHKAIVTRWIEHLVAKGDIYKARYEGLYCVPCETFVTDPVTSEDESQQCPSCHRSVQAISEENYFFRLSAYQDKLLAFFAENPDFIAPKERLNEVIAFVKGGLRDLSISRNTSSVDWGIPFPGDPEHTVYVWGDALMNYVSALGFDPEKKSAQFDTFWPANLQVMAKDIIKFHAVYFPAFLMAAGQQPAQKLLVHGYLLVDDDKMSKSKGNAFEPAMLAEQFGVDQVRYYLTRHMVTTHDGNLNMHDMAQRIGSDLANGLGNLLQRTASLALKFGSTEVTSAANWSDASITLKNQCGEMLAAYEDAMNAVNYAGALRALWKFIGQVNAYFHEQQPWLAAKEDMTRFKEVIAASSQSLYVIAHLIAPVMPYKSQQLLAALGHNAYQKKDALWANEWNVKCTLFVPKEPLFVRPELPKRQEEAPQQKAAPQKKEKAPSALPEGTIGIEDLIKVELVVGHITACEPMPKSDKLLCMQVDMGSYGQRQILAGIAQFFGSDDLIDKKAVFVANLPPRKMMGTESQGMMLFAKANDVNSLVTVDDTIPVGTRLS